MLKITEINKTRCSVTLKLEGRITGCWTEEVRKICFENLLKGCHLTLEMSDVSFVERGALPFFRQLQAKDVALINCSPFLSEQLKRGGFIC